MTSLLDDPKVREYFGCQPEHNHFGDLAVKCRNEQAMSILDAMQQPIKKGERYLLIDAEIIGEKIADSNALDHIEHLGALRLPDRFQKKEIYDLPSDFKLWGYSLPELRSMRNCALSHNWVPHPAPEVKLEYASPTFVGPIACEQCSHLFGTKEAFDKHICTLKPEDCSQGCGHLQHQGIKPDSAREEIEKEFERTVRTGFIDFQYWKRKIDEALARGTK